MGYAKLCVLGVCCELGLLALAAALCRRCWMLWLVRPSVLLGWRCPAVVALRGFGSPSLCVARVRSVVGPSASSLVRCLLSVWLRLALALVTGLARGPISLALAAGRWLLLSPLCCVSLSPLASSSCSPSRCSSRRWFGCCCRLSGAGLLGCCGVSAQWRRLCTLSPLLSALAGSLMSGCCCLWLPGSVPWLAVVASALWLALCLCCPPSAYRVARCCCRLCCTAAGLCWLCSASGLCWLAVVDLCAACTSRALSALAVSDWAAQAVAQPEPAWPRHAQRQRRVHLPAWGWGLGAGNR